MSHPAQRRFCKTVRKLFPAFFRRVNVVDIGSQDINGCARGLFRKSFYVGVDIHPGRNVDVVGRGHLVLPTLTPKLQPNYVWNPHLTRIECDGLFDTVISMEALEHDEFWRDTLRAMYAKLKPGGLLMITCAGDGRPEHGTTAHRPQDSPGTVDYYKNLSNEMFSEVLPAHLFTKYHLEQHSENCDLQFYGIKKQTNSSDTEGQFGAGC